MKNAPIPNIPYSIPEFPAPEPQPPNPAFSAQDTLPETEPEVRRLTPDPVEAQWLQRARSGEVAAFDWLMTRYRDRTVRLAAHILRQSADAEDLAQEAFLRAF